MAARKVGGWVVLMAVLVLGAWLQLNVPQVGEGFDQTADIAKADAIAQASTQR
jgi:hypothetical protein